MELVVRPTRAGDGWQHLAHLQGEISTVVQAVNEAVDASIVGWQKDMEAAAGLSDQRGPDEELARLADGVGRSRRPFLQVRHRTGA